MKRLLFASASACLCATLSVSPLFAQATPAAATPAQSTPAAPAKFIPPVKGTATIEVMRVGSKVVGKELVTTIKVKNTSSGSINLLKVDELWYDKKREMITSATERYRKPLLPGETIEMQLKSPLIGQPDVSQMMFGHANGKVDAKTVKKM